MTSPSALAPAPPEPPAQPAPSALASLSGRTGDGPRAALPPPLEWLRATTETAMARRGVVYPWWVAMLSALAVTIGAAVSLSFRDAWSTPLYPAAVLALIIVPRIAQLATAAPWLHLVETVTTSAAILWLVLTPPDTVFDPAPSLFAFLVAEVIARDGVRRGVQMTAFAGLVLVIAAIGPGIAALPLHLVDVILGLLLGYLLRWQMRALVAERIARETERARATLAERERIAREIHDLVAHSLSVTLLQITGARRALRDLASDEDTAADAGDQRRADIADVDAALADAERVGRRAMADIRQTVSTLAAPDDAARALPGAAQIGELIDQFRRAGVEVAYSVTGDPAGLGDATGVGLYRIAQESLANAVKHAPGQPVAVALSVAGDRFSLTISNAVSAVRASGPERGGDTGSGLVGMQARAKQLGAQLVTGLQSGPDGPQWTVLVRSPRRWSPLPGRPVSPRRSVRMPDEGA